MNNQKFGIGLEAEGYFMLSDGTPVARIENQPTTEYVLDRVERNYPQLREYLSLELPSIVMEVKTSTCETEMDAVQEIMRVREAVNKILPAEVSLIFAPSAQKEYPFVASTSDPNSRAQQLIAEWGCTAEGLRRLYASSISSLQINDSRPFRNCRSADNALEVARKAYNLFGERYEDLAAFNSDRVDFMGKRRMEHYFQLMAEVKRAHFAPLGFSDREIVIPPVFADVEAMKRWMCAHSGVTEFCQTDCKNEHGIVKLKRKSFYALETRCLDSVDSAEEMLIRAKFNSQLLAGLG